MNLVLPIFTKLHIGWNKKPITQKRLDSLCRRKKVKIKEMPLRVPGFYLRLRGVSCICIDERLNEFLKFKIALHEFAHHLLHGGKPHFYLLDPNLKEEDEAEVFAICGIIPKPLMQNILHNSLDLREFNISPELWKSRLKIWENYKI